MKVGRNRFVFLLLVIVGSAVYYGYQKVPTEVNEDAKIHEKAKETNEDLRAAVRNLNLDKKYKIPNDNHEEFIITFKTDGEQMRTYSWEPLVEILEEDDLDGLHEDIAIFYEDRYDSDEIRRAKNDWTWAQGVPCSKLALSKCINN
ncbi:hypothetical protein [Aureivirga sp. CE67]|uniref:hypothetical protein n=1 Tax=Aureivirga sp. CE67 TaxID=1788983 RepID=UPI0018CB465F|nr:hypothetical protein [Aureivirga sp. CE67]